MSSTPDTRQLSFLAEDTPTAPQKAEDSGPESASNAIARRAAYDAWNAAFLTRFYTARAAEMMNSGDATRITFYQSWLQKQQKE